MNIVKPYAKILSIDGCEPTLESGIKALKKIEWSGRISHRSEESQDADSWKRLLKAIVMEHADWSIVEHATATVDMLVDRGITHEWVRHRLNSFTQESTRFVNYEKKMPPSFINPNEDGSIDDDWSDAIRGCEASYKRLLAKGWPPQKARSVFPNALASRIITTTNLRNWRHCFIMRTTKEAHPQMRQVMIPLLAEFKEKIPLLYDDIEPLAKQSESMKKVR